MNIKIENGFWGMVRVLVIATLLMLVWGAAPVNASVYQVTTSSAPMRYICESSDLSSGYYAISTAEELKTFAGIVNQTVTPDEVTVTLDTGDVVAALDATNLSTNAKLTGDIDLSSVCGSGTGNWTPIGSDYSTKSYAGIFDGQGYTVKHLYISAATENLGLFGLVMNGTIKNLTVAGSIIADSGVKYVGGIVGQMWSDLSIVENCCSQVTLSGSLHDAGGIAGFAKGTIKNCRNQGVIMGTPSTYGNIGGIAGLLESAAVIDCENSAAITGSTRVGGIAGFCNGACSISNAANTAGVTAIGTGVGGICAHSTGGSKISNCRNTGNLEEGGSSSSEGSYAGGIVGNAYNNNHSGQPTLINNCYTTGSIHANTTGTATTTAAGTLVGKIGVDTSTAHPTKGVVDVSACYWLDSLTLTNKSDVISDKEAVGTDISAVSTIHITDCGSFATDQGKAASGSGTGTTIGTTGKNALADALNDGLTGNPTYSSWTVDPPKNSGYPIFESGGYTAVTAPTISAQPTDLSPNPSANYTLNLTATGATAYQWYQLENSSTDLGGTAIASATDSTYTTSQSVPGSYYYYCLVTATNANDITATARSNTVTVTVKPEASWELTTGGTTDSGTLAAAVAACNGNATGGTITLNKNLILASTITINKNITLLTAGSNKITRGIGLNQSNMFTVSDGAILTLGSTEGMGASNTLTLDGGAIWTGTIDPILGRGTTFSGISTTKSIINNQGTLNMHSGVTIQNNAYGGVTSASLVAVYNHPAAADKTATFNMDGGAITGNYGCEAGAIYNEGFSSAVDKTILNISGGRIEGNESNLVSNSGTGSGGIKNYGTFNLSGTAVIAGNKGTYAGGVDAGWKMTMTGGTITGNQGNYCGGIGQSYSVMSQLSLAGGSVTGNNATGDDTKGNTAGGLLPSKVSESTFSISGNPKVTGNTVGGTISKSGDGYTATGGNSVNMGLMNATGFKTPVFIKGALTNDAKIGVSLLTTGSADVVPTVGNPVIAAVPGAPVMDASSYLACFSSDNSSYVIAKDGNNLVLKVRTPVTISSSITSRAYNGQPIALDAAPVIKKAGDPVTIAELTYLYTSTDDKAYSNAAAPTNAGAYQLVISIPVGNSDYTGSSAAISFTVTPRSLEAEGLSINLPTNSYAYTGAEIKPAVSVADTGAAITADDYTITYTNNISSGMATVTITGKGNYQGTVTKTFSINAGHRCQSRHHYL